MSREELRALGGKPIIFRGSRYILRGIRDIPDRKSGIRTQILLQDMTVKNSFVIARAEEIESA